VGQEDDDRLRFNLACLASLAYSHGFLGCFSFCFCLLGEEGLLLLLVC